MTEDTFLALLHESPNDELTWLALADWLDEDGQPLRAELVRLVRRLRTIPVMTRTKKRAELEDRVAALLNARVRPVVPQITNGLGMRFALIPPGRFRMGSPSGEKYRQATERVREVEITRPFYLGVFPVTQRQFEHVMGRNPSTFRRGGRRDAVEHLPDEDLANFPVESVSCTEAEEFLERLAAREKGGLDYRLPTEAEWEYACRGGSASTTPFHFGSSLSPVHANVNGSYPDSEARRKTFLRRPSVVGSYAPNAFGLYDAHGNVWEWCADGYEEYDLSETVDPVGPEDSTLRVLRGGAWSLAGKFSRAAQRAAEEDFDSGPNLGFRAAAVRREA